MSTPVNDQPTLSATAVNPTFTEGGAAVDVFTTPVIASTVEAGQTFTSMTLTVTNVSAGASEILSFDGSDVALTNGNSVVTATNGLTVNVSLTGTTATRDLLRRPTLDAAHLQSLVDGIAYNNTSQDPGTANRVVTITQLVDSGSNTAPNDGTAALGIASTVHMLPRSTTAGGHDQHHHRAGGHGARADCGRFRPQRHGRQYAARPSRSRRCPAPAHSPTTAPRSLPASWSRLPTSTPASSPSRARPTPMALPMPPSPSRSRTMAAR